MVGGRNYDESPFNLATEGERQPGSSFKAFDLAAALEDGISPYSTWTSKRKVFLVPNTSGREKFVVHNDEGAYTGENTLINATAYSDNSIYAEVGLKVGTQRIAHLAHRMGITTPLSTNPAMTIGGLTVGVTPIDMAHAYETIARGGRRISGTLGEPGRRSASRKSTPARTRCQMAPTATSTRSGPYRCCRPTSPRPRPRCSKQCCSTAPRAWPRSGSSQPARQGPRPTTATPGSSAGTAGTRSPSGSATPNRLIPMTTQFNGSPVLGGTYPALIWHNFMVSALGIDKTRAEQAARAPRRKDHGTSGTSTAEEAVSSGATSGSGHPSPPAATKNTAPAHSSPHAPGGGGVPGKGGEAPPATPSPSATPSPGAAVDPDSALRARRTSPTPAAPTSKGGAASPETTGGVSPSG